MSLDRRTGRSGKDSVDHGPRGHDDVANAAAGALVAAAQQDREIFSCTNFMSPPGLDL